MRVTPEDLPSAGWTGRPLRAVGLLTRQADGSTLVPVPTPCAPAVPLPATPTGRRPGEAETPWSTPELRTAVEASPVGTALLDAAGRIQRVNPALCTLLDRPAAALVGRRLADLAHPDAVADVTAALVATPGSHFGSGSRAHAPATRWRRSDGWTWGRLHVTPDPATGTAVVHLEDVTEQRQARDVAAHARRHDGLTGLPNRALVLDRIQTSLDAAGRRVGRVAVLLCAVDRLAHVNDGMGHESGDVVLLAVARRLTGVLAPGQSAGRLGGDEFVVVCEDVSGTAAALALAERLRAAVSAPLRVRGRDVVPSVSVGVAVSGPVVDSPLALLRDAHTAMARAKSSGGDRCDLADVRLRQAAQERLDTELALREALVEGQLRLHFQPIVDVASGRRTGHEALVRWQHPRRGLLGPAQFLDVAEECGLIVELGSWVLREATAAAAAAPAAGYVTVNVSGAQLARPGLAAEVGRALAASGLPAERLVIELTESAMLAATGVARDELTLLDDAGVRIVVDDFGTGFATLSYLRDLPVRGLKVDRSFTAGLGGDERCERIVEALTSLGRGLGLDVVVEGVETAEQRAVLLRLGCTRAQGYLFGRAEPSLSGTRP